MPTYLFRCPAQHETTQWFSIHSTLPRRIRCDHCTQYAVRILTAPAISIDALPNKAEDARRAVQRERRWAKDMDAYKRLRRQGLQPKGVDGSAMAEQQARDPLEIHYGHRIPDLKAARDIHAQLSEQDARRSAPKARKAIKGK